MAFSYASISEEAGDLDGICLMGYSVSRESAVSRNYEQAMEYYQRVLETEEPELTMNTRGMRLPQDSAPCMSRGKAWRPMSGRLCPILRWRLTEVIVWPSIWWV